MNGKLKVSIASFEHNFCAPHAVGTNSDKIRTDRTSCPCMMPLTRVVIEDIWYVVLVYLRNHRPSMHEKVVSYSPAADAVYLVAYPDLLEKLVNAFERYYCQDANIQHCR